MIHQIIAFSIQHKWVVALGTLAIIIAGIASFRQLPIDAIPDITNNQVQILTVCPTLATQEVEQFVTAPIENAVRSLPGLTELRSISRFGLSVVTVVFVESLDPYRARQLINERLKMAEAEIPTQFGRPELAPLSTGLGEILHYRIEPLPGFEQHYSPADLRVMQDWIVKKQLTGVPGVVEINSFGGLVKQYEVALNPQRLQQLGVGVLEVLEALENANQNTGGAYIEKNSAIYFIRAEGLARSLDDLRQIIVRNTAGMPLRIGDVAEVRFGHALRYGAVSHNGQGEIVVGIVMMLKGENAAQVIGRVKAKLAAIQQSLPAGVVITTFLDREKLVRRTIDTVKQNLLEGALIVVFVLVLLVGNWRAGFIIASVIPLAMLFAIAMMWWFGVSANLMSLGALDFGLIVDGAVIIVESVLHFLHLRYGPHATGVPVVRLSAAEMDASVRRSAEGIMRSAVFGILIILIVYLPILALEGIEGKMFRPMAQTVSFALLGALLLSLTYVPAATAFFLQKKLDFKPRLADRIIGTLQRGYQPLLGAALRQPRLMVGLSGLLLVGALVVFFRLGGEFIPTLDEGDIMMHGFLRPGSSLQQTLESHRLVQTALLKGFPNEVEQVISKIGSAEIPTDPMAIETADNIILLKPQEQWTKASTKTELIELLEKTAKTVPGMAFEFTQPIKMRFDEMMTGVRADIAVKIFGDNLDSLAQLGHRVEQLLSRIPGLADLKVEQIEGQPQITVKYHFDKIAQYGLHLADVNATLRTAFAGATAGVIYEDGRRFDLVVRLEESFRGSLEDIRQLPVATPNGGLVPLQEIAAIDLTLGAAQISRDEGRRRIVIGANVRGTDVQTAIKQVQERLTNRLRLPVGYTLAYGGQFENLQSAKARLAWAVPLALGLIFLLLFLSFQSWQESLLIFTAIPMAAIGGVAALALRSMPFSISAGVGFIALFGVAVLNGIVLIAYFNQLAATTNLTLGERIRQGASTRLRPVLMTAAVAALGFLPMALSQGAGAEVQRPLATVVIGGLVSSTFLTLFLLPVLYAALPGGWSWRRRVPPALVLVPLLLGGSALAAQDTLREEAAVALVIQNHPAMRAAQSTVQYQQTLRGTARAYEPANLFQNVTADPDLGLLGTTTLGLSQEFPNRRTVQSTRRWYQQQTELATAALAQTREGLVRQVREIYQHLGYLQQKALLYQRLDSLYQALHQVAAARYRNGDAALVEKMALQDQAVRVKLERETIGHELDFDLVVLGQLLGQSRPVIARAAPLQARSFTLDDTLKILTAPTALVSQAGIGVAREAYELAKAKLQPSFSAGFYGQVLGNGAFYPGWQLGLNLPLFNQARRTNVEAAQVQVAINQHHFEKTLLEQRAALAHLLHEQEKYQILLDYYTREGQLLAKELLRSATLNYQQGEMDYPTLVYQLTQATQMELEYLNNLYGLNLTVVELKFLTGQ